VDESRDSNIVDTAIAVPETAAHVAQSSVETGFNTLHAALSALTDKVERLAGTVETLAVSTAENTRQEVVSIPPTIEHAVEEPVKEIKSKSRRYGTWR
jgi:hypothetical protein